MQAVYIESHGGPEVLTLGNRPDPIVQPHEVKVRVRATSLNRLDLYTRAGDRALQLDMDRKSMEAMEGYRPAAEQMICADQDVQVGFLEAEVLEEWREWVRRFMGWEFSWDRLKRALNRMYRDDDDVQQAVDRFLQGMPHSLERVYEKIPEEKLDAYQQRVLEATVAQAREYMSGT